MKKILKSKKGFTLIELLAVIVVLAIIMVIATQQVNSTIKKSRANAYADSVKAIKKGLQTLCATDGSISNVGLGAAIEYSDVTIKMVSGSNSVEINPTSGGKYNNMDITILSNDLSTPYVVNGTKVTFNADCNAKEAIE